MKPVLLTEFLRGCGSGELTKIDAQHYPWELLIRQSRRANLISRVALFLREAGMLDGVPTQPRQHFLNALCIAKANARATNWEVRELYRILRGQNIDFILLKGSAYIWSENSASKGRLFSDVDIMVRESSLEDAERLLVHSGWMGSTLNGYDQRYYRQWMHEIPPLQHLKRQTTLDLHHSIIPPVSHPDFPAEKLWQQATPAEDMPGLFMLSHTDMILHSATHLFHEGEFDQGLRDLSDLDLMIREYVLDGTLWEALLLRAAELGLALPLYYALNYTQRVLGTPVPEQILQKAARQRGQRHLPDGVLDLLFLTAFVPDHETCRVRGGKVARFLLFIRSHWIKMPWHLLLPHLVRKGWLRLRGENSH